MNWKTTLSGCAFVGALCTFLISLIPTMAAGLPWLVTAQPYLALIAAVSGFVNAYFQKDKDVTGGIRPQAGHAAPEILLAIVLACLLCLTMVGPARAMTWYQANQATLAWDSSTVQGGLPAGDVIKYDVYIVLMDDVGKANPVKQTPAPIAATDFTIAFSSEGSYYAGVKALRFNSGDTLLSESAFSWSDSPAACKDGKDFGIRYYVSPSTPKGLRPQ